MNIGVTNFLVHVILVIIHVVPVGIHLGVAEPESVCILGFK